MFKNALFIGACSLVLILISPLSQASGYKGQLEVISATDLLNNKADYVVLDTRSKQEFDQGHIEGAINIPHSQVKDQLAKLKGIDKTIVVHCRSGRRALTAEQALLDNGFTNLKHLEGDMNGWLANDLPVVSNK